MRVLEISSVIFAVIAFGTYCVGAPTFIYVPAAVVAAFLAWFAWLRG